MNNLKPIDIKILEEHNISLTEEVLNKINNGYPIQYLVGDTEFYGYPFLVNENVLIPRFETEQLVEKVLSKIDFKVNKVLDICSGSGVIGITLNKKLNCSTDLLEKSHSANEVAKKNIELNQVSDVNIIEADLFNYSIKDEYDLIISNPPYLTTTDPVDPNTRFEPEMALYSNDDNIKYYKYIIDQAIKLNNWHLIAFEIGETEKHAIIEYAKSKGLNHIYGEVDYNNKDRFIFITK